MQIDRQPGAGDGVAEFVGESSRQLAKQPLPLTGDERTAELFQLQAHVVDAVHEPADLVAGGWVGVAGDKRVAKLPLRDPCHVPFDGGDPRRESARRSQPQRHEHRERPGGHRQHGPDGLDCAGDERSLRREHEHRFRPHALATDRAQPVSVAVEGAAACADRSGYRVAVNCCERLRGQRRESDAAGRFIPDQKMAAGQPVQGVEHGGRE